jgi:hypothetical protein
MWVAIGVLYKPLLDKEKAALAAESAKPKFTDCEMVQAAGAEAF